VPRLDRLERPAGRLLAASTAKVNTMPLTASSDCPYKRVFTAQRHDERFTARSQTRYIVTLKASRDGPDTTS